MKTDKDAFVTTWRMDSDDLDITIPTHCDTDYDYVVDWGDGNTSRHEGDASHVYPKAGEYQVSITGIFPRIYFWKSKNSDQKKIIAIDQWGAIQWESMDFAFYRCSNLAGQATDTPDLSRVRDMVCMFEGATAFNQNVTNWDVRNVVDMRGMFEGAAAFNQDLSRWDVGGVQNMGWMFYGATAFNQNLRNWNVDNVQYMEDIFLHSGLSPENKKKMKSKFNL